MAKRYPNPRYCIEHVRFTEQAGWRLRDLSLSLNGNISVTGFNANTLRTYLDVYTNVNVGHSGSRDKPKVIYSKEFAKYPGGNAGRLVSFIDSYDSNRGLVIVTCLADKIQLIDLNEDEIIHSRRVKLVKYGGIHCLSVRESREIFISFYQSNKITVYDVIDLNEIKSIILQGIQDDCYPYDMTAIAGKIFACIVGKGKEGSIHRSLIFEEKNGGILSELTKPTDTAQCNLEGLALNTTLNVITVAWSQTYEGTRERKDVIVFYSLLSENNCSFLIVEDEFGFSRIRISDRGDRMITGRNRTGEVKVYDMSEFFSYGHLKDNLQSQLQENDCLKLTDFFALPDNQRDEIFKSDASSKNLLLALEGKGAIQPNDVARLAEAFTELGIKSSCSYLVDFYQKTRTYNETIQKLQEKKQEEVEHMEKRPETENKAQVQNLQQELQRMKQEQKETEKLLHQTKDLHEQTTLERNKFKSDYDQYKLELESARQNLLQTKELLTKVKKENNVIRADLDQSQLQYSIKSMSLKGSPDGSRLAETAQARPPEVRTSSKGNMTSATSGCLQDSDIASELSKLIVKVSEELSNAHCVQLATYFNLPRSKLDLIRNDSETPGITLLNVMKERNLINMYDVSNLQQALEDIKICDINETLVKPYQELAAASVLLK